MEIKISKAGLLWTKRSGEYRKRLCPLRFRITSCGDWCALFGEPEHGTLQICQGRVLVGTIVDERPGSGGDGTEVE